MDVQVDNGALFQALSIFICMKAFIGKLEENVRRIMINFGVPAFKLRMIHMECNLIIDSILSHPLNPINRMKD